MTLPWTPALPIRTARLELREHRYEDVDDMLEFHSDPEVVRYIPWPVQTREEVLAALDLRVGAGRVTAPGSWLILAIVLDGRVIGEVLLKHSSDEEGELGYALHRSFHGRGLASEASAAMLGLARGFGVRRVVATLDERNAASSALLAKLGFTLQRAYPEEFKGEQITSLEYALLL